jgi:hypothetical protein
MILYAVSIPGAFPFAKCFICQEMGHLARSCPENPRGLYPQGSHVFILTLILNFNNYNNLYYWF